MKKHTLPPKIRFSVRILLALFFLFMIAKGILSMACGFHAGNQAAAISGLLAAVFWGIAFSIAAVPSFVGSIAEKLSSGIFYPVRKLDAPPVMLSPVRGMIRDGRVEEAEKILLSLRKEYPFDGRIVFMLADLRMSGLHDPVNAAELIEEFFSAKGRKTGDPVQLLLRHGDCCLALHDPARSVRLIEQKMKDCDAVHRSSLEKRLLNLKEKQNGIS